VRTSASRPTVPAFSAERQASRFSNGMRQLGALIFAADARPRVASLDIATSTKTSRSGIAGDRSQSAGFRAATGAVTAVADKDGFNWLRPVALTVRRKLLDQSRRFHARGGVPRDGPGAGKVGLRTVMDVSTTTQRRGQNDHSCSTGSSRLLPPPQRGRNLEMSSCCANTRPSTT